MDYQSIVGLFSNKYSLKFEINFLLHHMVLWKLYCKPLKQSNSHVQLSGVTGYSDYWLVIQTVLMFISLIFQQINAFPTNKHKQFSLDIFIYVPADCYFHEQTLPKLHLLMIPQTNSMSIFPISSIYILLSDYLFEPPCLCLSMCNFSTICYLTLLSALTNWVALSENVHQQSSCIFCCVSKTFGRQVRIKCW